MNSFLSINAPTFQLSPVLNKVRVGTSNAAAIWAGPVSFVIITSHILIATDNSIKFTSSIKKEFFSKAYLYIFSDGPIRIKIL